MTTSDEALMSRIVEALGGREAADEDPSSGTILSISAALYGSVPDDEDVTRPTGFDPQAAALFESIVEAAFLVANADGDFDATERAVFEKVVVLSCGGSVKPAQVGALVEDLTEMLEEDGLAKRAEMVARTVTRKEHCEEVLRVAALIAFASEGVSDVEREMLDAIRGNFDLPPGAVDEAIETARKVVEG